MSNAATKIRDANEYVVELVKAKDAQGKPFFAYLLLQKSDLPAFKESLARSKTDLAKYGVVLATGPGHKPSTEVWKAVQAKLKKA